MLIFFLLVSSAGHFKLCSCSREPLWIAKTPTFKVTCFLFFTGFIKAMEFIILDFIHKRLFASPI